ncbi:MAG TPA: hypothetical protein VGO72_03190, partial [Herminiimonas sp.]|nr:hypothetical protein [Herminiimonas sp.]
FKSWLMFCPQAAGRIRPAAFSLQDDSLFAVIPAQVGTTANMRCRDCGSGPYRQPAKHFTTIG